MNVTSQLRALDDRVLPRRSNTAQDRWGRRHGWSLFAALGCLLAGFGTWALAADRPAMAVVPMTMGIGYLVLAACMFVARDKRASS